MSQTIVLIDDDQDDLDFMQDVLQEMDASLQCITFLRPTEALRVVSQEMILMPDVIITDINMPEITGDKCVEFFRKNTDFDETKIVVMSTTMLAETRERMQSLGATFAYQKPTAPADYKRIFEEILA